MRLDIKQLVRGRFTIGKRLWGGFSAIILLVTATSFVATHQLSRIETANNSLIAQRFPTLLACWQLNAHMAEASAAVRGRLLATDSASRHEMAAQEETAWSGIDAALKDLNALRKKGAFGDPKSKDKQTLAEFGLLDKINNNVTQMLLPSYQQIDQVAQTHSKADIANAVFMMNSIVVPYAQKVSDLTEKLLKIQSKAEALDSAAAKSAVSSTKIVLDSANGLVLLLGLLIAWLTAPKILRAVRALVQRTGAISAGDLTGEPLPSMGNDELGDLTAGINQMQASLRSILESVVSTTERVASASEEISSNATEQAHGSEMQRDQAHQVATAMQEMSSTVQQVSENSNQAADAARQAADTARNGGKIVEETLEKMRAIADTVTDTARKVQELGKSSNQIGEIISVIDDIADQTNLLALNAAIEAARAGEQGRGFAVVADEVRKLAERTTQATKEITQMIKSIQAETQSPVDAMFAGTRQVESGVATTAQAGASLSEIIEMAERVGEMITHIATAATQQAGATEEVNSSIDQISKITQEAASGAHQSAKACQELSGLALDLQNLVSQFKIAHHGNGGFASGGFGADTYTDLNPAAAAASQWGN